MAVVQSHRRVVRLQKHNLDLANADGPPTSDNTLNVSVNNRIHLQWAEVFDRKTTSESGSHYIEG